MTRMMTIDRLPLAMNSLSILIHTHTEMPRDTYGSPTQKHRTFSLSLNGSVELTDGSMSVSLLDVSHVSKLAINVT